MKTALKSGVALFGMAAVGLMIAHYRAATGEVVLAPLALLAGVVACACLLKLKAMDYKEQPSKARKLRYAYLLLFLVILIDLVLFLNQ